MEFGKLLQSASPHKPLCFHGTFSTCTQTLSENACNKQNTQFSIYKHISFFNCCMFRPYWLSSWNHSRSCL